MLFCFNIIIYKKYRFHLDFRLILVSHIEWSSLWEDMRHDRFEMSRVLFPRQTVEISYLLSKINFLSRCSIHTVHRIRKNYIIHSIGYKETIQSQYTGKFINRIEKTKKYNSKFNNSTTFTKFHQELGSSRLSWFRQWWMVKHRLIFIGINNYK